MLQCNSHLFSFCDLLSQIAETALPEYAKAVMFVSTAGVASVTKILGWLSLEDVTKDC